MHYKSNCNLTTYAIIYHKKSNHKKKKQQMQFLLNLTFDELIRISTNIELYWRKGDSVKEVG